MNEYNSQIKRGSSEHDAIKQMDIRIPEDSAFTAAELRDRIQKQVESKLCPNCGHDQKEDGFPMNCISCAWPQYQQLTPQEELEDARTEARLDAQAEREDQESHYYSLRDEGRNDDGTGESYGERNL